MTQIINGSKQLDWASFKALEVLGDHLTNFDELDEWYNKMAPHLFVSDILDPQYGYVISIRYNALVALSEMLFMHEAHEQIGDQAELQQRLENRFYWLTAKIAEAAELYPDIADSFLRYLKYGNPSPPFDKLIPAYFIELMNNRPAYVDQCLLRALMVYQEEYDGYMKYLEWIKMLDDPCYLVAEAAAERLGSMEDRDDSLWCEFFEIIREKELERPGLMGAFYGPCHEMGYFPASKEECRVCAEWMMDLLEKRQVSCERNHKSLCMDISFYITEVCQDMSDMVERMIQNGFIMIAIKTAINYQGKIDGMEPILSALAENIDKDIRQLAQSHLEQYY